MNELDSTVQAVLLNLPLEYATQIEDFGNGTLAIRQIDQMGGDSDLVILTKSQAAHVYLALRTFLDGA